MVRWLEPRCTWMIFILPVLYQIMIYVTSPLLTMQQEQEFFNILENANDNLALNPEHVCLQSIESQLAQEKIEVDHLQELLAAAKEKAAHDKEALKKATR